MAAIKALKGTCLSKESEEAYRGTVSVMPPGGDPEQWSPSQVKAWLIALGLGQFADAFEEQEVDGSCVAGSDPEPSLTEDVLAELGVVKLGDILRFRRGLCLPTATLCYVIPCSRRVCCSLQPSCVPGLAAIARGAPGRSFRVFGDARPTQRVLGCASRC